jgi:hypothetical protein
VGVTTVGGSPVVVVSLDDAENEVVRNLPIGEADSEGMEEEAVRALMRAEEGSKPSNSKHNYHAGVNEYRKIDVLLMWSIPRWSGYVCRGRRCRCGGGDHSSARERSRRHLRWHDRRGVRREGVADSEGSWRDDVNRGALQPRMVGCKEERE